LILLVCRGGPNNVRLFEVFGLREDWVRVGEIHHADRIGIGNIAAWRPQCDEHSRTDGVVVVPQEAEVDAEVSDQVGDHLFTDRDVGDRGGGHQRGRRPGHQVV
jgi:hypothetical protein